MKKNIRDYKKTGVQFAYFLDSCSPEDLECNATDRDVIFTVLDNFNIEFNYPYNVARWPNLRDRLEQWLRGLPTGIHIAFRDGDIADLGRSWGYCATPRATAKFVEDYWGVLAWRLIQLGTYFGYEMSKLA